jgi:1-pyrroline-5-carboxylate dehydrogenase
MREITEFKNEPLTDFNVPANRKAMEEAIRTVEGQLGRTYKIVIGGREMEGDGTFSSTNPSRPDQVVGVFPKATVELADAAVKSAYTAFQTWSRTPARDRAELLFRLAGILRGRKHEFSAWMVHEAGKNWPEADGDTAEAIDFCEFYGREMLRYSAEQPLTRIAGEKNELHYIPIGVGAVIPPWNFPLAILVGMTLAAVVTGNTVVLKPASDTPTIAAKFFEILQEAGMPPGVVNFLPGPGSLAGEGLVKHPLVRFIAFTGSKAVGLRINELAAKTPPGQKWVKRVVLEMGGKDFIIVNDDADVDAAAAGIVAAAFGFQGQKCSACSRAIVTAPVYDAVLSRVIDQTRALKLGPALDPATQVGPVINADAKAKILNYIETGKAEGRLVAGGGAGAGDGHFVQPTVIADVAETARIAQEEIFGPVLAIIKAKDLDDAIRIANGTEYGLTGAVYTKDRSLIEKSKAECFAGNFYVNRKCTGALVGVHPFGGFNMSGTDSKAGGRDYLLLFLQAKAISEKILA